MLSGRAGRAHARARGMRAYARRATAASAALAWIATSAAAVLAAYHAHERLSVTLAASSRLDEPEFSSGTEAEAVQVAPFSNLLST